MRIAVPDAYQMEPYVYVAQTYAKDIVSAGMNFSVTTYKKSKLSLREFEGARTRTAQINGCQACQSFRANRDLPDMFQLREEAVTQNGPAPDEAFYQAVSEFRTSSILSARERLAIEYAEGMGLDPQGLAQDEAFWARFKAAFSDDEIVDLSFCVAAWIGFGRVAHALGIDTVCAIPALRPAAA
jgi:alkylhydroperoxidase family enzyme